jgi:hypothetical protein
MGNKRADTLPEKKHLHWRSPQLRRSMGCNRFHILLSAILSTINFKEKKLMKSLSLKGLVPRILPCRACSTACEIETFACF